MNTLKDYVNFRLTHADKLSEAKGYPLELYDCKKYKPMRDLKIYGESVQDGIPSPQTPIEVQCVGDLSVNLLPDVRDIYNGNGSDGSRIANGYAELTEDGRECIRFKSSTGDVKYTKIKFKENTQYTISFDCKVIKIDGYSSYPSYDIPLVVYYTNGNYRAITATNDGVWRRLTFTTSANLTIDYIGLYSYDYRDFIYVDINTFQIEEGTVATSYQPYYDGYKIQLTTRGLNLTDGILELGNIATATGQNTNSDSYFRSKNYTTVKPNTAYMIYATKKIQFVFFYDKDYSFIKCTSENAKTFTTPENCEYIRYRVLKSNSDITNIMLVEGSTEIEYEPYAEPTVTNIFLDKPLCKFGDYVDVLDVKNNKVVRNIDKLLVNTDLSWEWWNLNIDKEDVVSIYRTSFISAVYQPTYQISSNYFPYYNWNDVGDNVNLVWCAGASAGFKISTSLIEGYDYTWSKQQKIQAFLSWAESIGLEWYLARKTPREETIDINIPKIKSKTSIIEVATSLAPSSVFGKYIKK